MNPVFWLRHSEIQPKALQQVDQLQEVQTCSEVLVKICLTPSKPTKMPGASREALFSLKLQSCPKAFESTLGGAFLVVACTEKSRVSA